MFKLSAEDFIWLICHLRSATAPEQERIPECPAWTAFNALVLRNYLLRPSVVEDLPVISSSPTKLATVDLLLKRSTLLADQLKQDSVIVFVVQAVYAKALKIVFKHQTEFSQVVLRMGAFHIAMTFMVVIGKRFGDGGLHDLLIESGVLEVNAVGCS